MTHWWQSAVIYQIYPRSFQDTNGDGIGDLPGIRRRLDYLQWLGVDALWLSPIFPSPMADFGYDVSDYRDVHPMFGTLADLDALLDAVHQRDMRLLLDFVPNHTSDQHPWFQEARSSRDNPYRDWYIWCDPAPDGGPPNNWLSRFDGASAWEWDAVTEQYYLHSFLKEQPDLNWRNAAARAAMLDVMRFWFDRGIDGLRVDVAYRVMKDADLQDNPPNPNWQPGLDPSFRVVERYTKDTPDNHLFNRWLRQVADEYADRVLVGEMNLPFTRLVPHYGTTAAPEFHLPFNFRLIFSHWEAANVRALAAEYERLLPDHAWPNWVLSNHDQSRFASRAGAAQARNGLLFLLTMRGTPTIYYGEELALPDVPIPPEQVQDPWELLAPGLGLGRDPVRTPLPWDRSPNAGFCPPEVVPWLPPGEDAGERSVAAQQADPRSALALTRRLLALRRASPALRLGAYRALPAGEALLAFARVGDDGTFVTLLNFSAAPQTWAPPPELGALTLLLSTALDAPQAVGRDTVTLRANEGLLLRVTDS
jgi:alpha-glucosidase